MVKARVKDYYADNNKSNPVVHKKSMKYAVKNDIIKNGTIAKFTFKKSGARGGYHAQKVSFDKLLKSYLDKKGLKTSNKKNVCDVDFETMTFKVVSK